MDAIESLIMPNHLAHDLRQAGVPFGGYRELAQPIQDGQGASRWPLLALTDQILVAQRWKRNAMNRQANPSNVTALPTRQTANEAPRDWFASPPPPVVVPIKSATR